MQNPRIPTGGGQSSQGLTKICLANIEEYDSAVNAFVTVLEETAMAEAEAADLAEAEGRRLGLLHGMPVAVKDNINVAGVQTTNGSPAFENCIPTEDAEIVYRLRKAGAVLIGKATLQELAFGIRSNNPVTGQCRNPWKLEHVPGGSSGGSAAAIAAAMTVGALGTDAGGSVRCPASMSGVVGLRPTLGSISMRGIIPAGIGFDTVGPMARRVEDVARLFVALAGYDRLDPTSVELQPFGNIMNSLQEELKDVRIGIPINAYFTNTSHEIRDAVVRASQVFEDLGGHLKKIEIEGVEENEKWLRIMNFSGACAVHSDLLKNTPHLVTSQVYERMIKGFEYSAVDYANAVDAQQRWKRTLSYIFESVDLILSPTVPIMVPFIDESRDLFDGTRDAARFLFGGSLAGIPSISIPCGFSHDGLPIGMLLESSWWNEALLFQAGAAYQAATEWHLTHPALINAE